MPVRQSLQKVSVIRHLNSRKLHHGGILEQHPARVLPYLRCEDVRRLSAETGEWIKWVFFPGLCDPPVQSVRKPVVRLYAEAVSGS